MIKLTAFRSLPPFAQGLARDFRVRWALEEARIPYEARLIGPEDQASAAYRALQPFGQIPAMGPNHSLTDWARPRTMYGKGGTVEANGRYRASS
jgi:hypothetical protein